MTKIALKLITPPALEPISLAEAKAHMRLNDTTAEDALITALITAAREYCEGFQNRAYLEQTFELWLDDWPYRDCIAIPRPPLQSVTSIKYYGTDNAEYTMTAADYFVDTKNEPGRVSLAYSKTWPTTTLRPANGALVTFTAGYASYAGTVNTSGTAVTWVSGDKFGTGWTAGKAIIINSVVYMVASVTSDAALTLTATAGTQSAAVYSTNDVPQIIKQAILLLIGDMHENRENSSNAQFYEAPFAVKALLWQDRLVPI